MVGLTVYGLGMAFGTRVNAVMDCQRYVWHDAVLQIRGVLVV